MLIKLFFLFALLVGYNMALNPECMQPIQTGPCRASMPRFGYNVNSRRCEPFVYGGCQGNSNNFPSLAACQSRCS